MDKRVKIINDLNLFEKYKRVITISDCHGDIISLEKLLDKIDFCTNDYLILLGDIVQKGLDNIVALKIFCNKYDKLENVLILMGNHEEYITRLIDNVDIDSIIWFYNTFPNSIFREWGNEIGLSTLNEKNIPNLCYYVKKNYEDQLNFLRNLDVALQSKDFIFVHSGIENYKSLEESSFYDVIRNYDYIFDGINVTGKWIIIGHIPVFNSKNGVISNNPYIWQDKKIIAIDGGNNVLKYSQLNAFVIEKIDNSYKFSNYFEDNDCETFAKKNFASNPHNIGLTNDNFKTGYKDNKIEILEKGVDFSFVKKVDSLETGFLKNEFINNNTSFCGFSKLLNVKKDEKLKLIDTNFGNYSLVKNLEGYMGFIPHEYI